MLAAIGNLRLAMLLVLTPMFGGGAQASALGPQSAVVGSPVNAANPPRTVDGLRIVLVRADFPKLPLPHGLPALRADRRWLETVWSFQNVAHHPIRLSRPTAEANQFNATAYAPHSAAEQRTLKPGESRRVNWYFQVPHRSRGLWIGYSTGSAALWYHMTLP